MEIETTEKIVKESDLKFQSNYDKDVQDAWENYGKKWFAVDDVLDWINSKLEVLWSNLEEEKKHIEHRNTTNSILNTQLNLYWLEQRIKDFEELKALLTQKPKGE